MPVKARCVVVCMCVGVVDWCVCGGYLTGVYVYFYGSTKAHVTWKSAHGCVYIIVLSPSHPFLTPSQVLLAADQPATTLALLHATPDEVSPLQRVRLTGPSSGALFNRVAVVPDAHVVLLGSNAKCLYALHVARGQSDMGAGGQSDTGSQSDMRVDYVSQFRMAFPILGVAGVMVEGEGDAVGQQVCVGMSGDLGVQGLCVCGVCVCMYLHHCVQSMASMCVLHNPLYTTRHTHTISPPTLLHPGCIPLLHPNQRRQPLSPPPRTLQSHPTRGPSRRRTPHHSSRGPPPSHLEWGPHPRTTRGPPTHTRHPGGECGGGCGGDTLHSN